MPVAARCYMSATIAVAIGIVAYLPWSRTPLYALLVLSCVMAVVERISVIDTGQADISVSLVVSLAATLILPPAGAAVAGVVSAVARRGNVGAFKTAFNAAMFGILMAIASQTYLSLGGHDDLEPLVFPNTLWPYFAAVTVCWLMNVVFASGAVSLLYGKRFWSIVTDGLSLTALPYYASSALSLIITALWDSRSFGIITALLTIVPMYTAHWVLSQQSREQAAYESTINALVQAVEIKDHYTRGHSERVAKGSELIARRMEFPESRVSKLRYAGLLHDIGKLSIPTRLLEKTGKLTDAEYREIQLHPNHGVAVIRDITFLTEVYDAILYHHERLDGRGYPQGRRGDEIPEFARIIGVADAFDAMTSTRSYRAARPVPEAVAELWRGAGTQFDPEIVRAFDEALTLEDEAGRPWQVTERIPGEAEGWTDPAKPAVPEYSFGDHDDPSIAERWYAGPLGELPPPPEPIGRERLHSGPNLLNSWPTPTTPSIEDAYPRIGSGPFQIRPRPEAPEPLDRRLDHQRRVFEPPTTPTVPTVPPPASSPPPPPLPSMPSVFDYRDEVPLTEELLADDGPDADVIPLRRRSAPAAPLPASEPVSRSLPMQMPTRMPTRTQALAPEPAADDDTAASRRTASQEPEPAAVTEAAPGSPAGSRTDAPSGSSPAPSSGSPSSSSSSGAPRPTPEPPPTPTSTPTSSSDAQADPDPIREDDDSPSPTATVPAPPTPPAPRPSIPAQASAPTPTPDPAPIPHQTRHDHEAPTIEMPRIQSTGSAE